MKNTRTVSLLLLAVVVAALQACSDDGVEPQATKWRAEKITYDFGAGQNYKAMKYDRNGRLVAIVTGQVDSEGISETTHHLQYEAGRLVAMVADEDVIPSYEYAYSRTGLLTETHVYSENSLVETHKYTYDAAGKLVKDIAWSRATQNGAFGPALQLEYLYDSHGNVIEKRYYRHNGTEFTKTQQVRYLSFDSMKNPEHFFPNALNPQAILFSNNPLRMKLVNSNGTTAEQTFRYEYNCDGLATKQTNVETGSTMQFELKALNPSSGGEKPTR